MLQRFLKVQQIEKYSFIFFLFFLNFGVDFVIVMSYKQPHTIQQACAEGNT